MEKLLAKREVFVLYAPSISFLRVLFPLKRMHGTRLNRNWTRREVFELYAPSFAFLRATSPLKRMHDTLLNRKWTLSLSRYVPGCSVTLPARLSGQDVAGSLLSVLILTPPTHPRRCCVSAGATREVVRENTRVWERRTRVCGKGEHACVGVSACARGGVVSCPKVGLHVNR